VNETLKTASKENIKSTNTSRIRRGVELVKSTGIIKQEKKPLASSMIMASQNDLLDFSYRKVEMVPWSKIPPKLKSDRPDFRPHNKNYVEYLSHLEKHKLRRGQRVSQSLGVTTYVKDAQKEV